MFLWKQLSDSHSQQERFFRPLGSGALNSPPLPPPLPSPRHIYGGEYPTDEASHKAELQEARGLGGTCQLLRQKYGASLVQG